MAKASASPNREILEAALQGLELQKEKLDAQIAHVRALMGVRPPGRPSKSAKAQMASEPAPHRGPVAGKKRRQLSAEARKRIAAAQKKRWATFRKTQS